MELTNGGDVATNIEGVVDAELLVVVGRSYHYFKNYDSCEKAALAFDRERLCVSGTKIL